MSDTAHIDLDALQRDLVALKTFRLNFIRCRFRLLKILTSCWRLKRQFNLLSPVEIKKVIGIGKGALNIAALSAERHLWVSGYTRPVVTLLEWKTPTVSRHSDSNTREELGFAVVQENIDQLYARDWADEGASGQEELLSLALETLKFCTGGTLTVDLANQNVAIDVFVEDFDNDSTRSRLMDLTTHTLIALARGHAAVFVEYGRVDVSLWGWKVYMPRDPCLFRVSGKDLWHIPSESSVGTHQGSPEETLQNSSAVQREYRKGLFRELSALTFQVPTTVAQYLSFVGKATRIMVMSIRGIGLPGLRNQRLFDAGLQALQKLASVSDHFLGFSQRTDHWSASSMPMFEGYPAPSDRQLLRSWAVRRQLSLLHSSDWKNPGVLKLLIDVLTLSSRATIKILLEEDKRVNLPPPPLADHPGLAAILKYDTQRHVESAFVVAAQILQFHFADHEVKLWGHSFCRPRDMVQFALGNMQRAFAEDVDYDLKQLQQSCDFTRKPSRREMDACIAESTALIHKLVKAQSDFTLETREYYQKRFEAAQQVITELSTCIRKFWDLNTMKANFDAYSTGRLRIEKPDTDILHDQRAWAIFCLLDRQESSPRDKSSLDAGANVLRGSIGSRVDVSLQGGTTTVICPEVSTLNQGLENLMMQTTVWAMIGVAMYVSGQFDCAEVKLWHLEIKHGLSPEGWRG